MHTTTLSCIWTFKFMWEVLLHSRLIFFITWTPSNHLLQIWDENTILLNNYSLKVWNNCSYIYKIAKACILMIFFCGFFAETYTEITQIVRLVAIRYYKVTLCRQKQWYAKQKHLGCKKTNKRWPRVTKLILVRKTPCKLLCACEVKVSMARYKLLGPNRYL